MNTHNRGVLVCLIPLLLLLMTGVELVGVSIAVIGAPSGQVAATFAGPLSFASLTLAVVAVSSLRPARWVRLIVACGTGALLLYRAGLVTAAGVADGGFRALGWHEVTAMISGLGVGLALLMWAFMGVRGPVGDPTPEFGVSPSAPQAPAPRPTDRWSTTSTPWPRANEEDPDGTLIRPRRR